MAAGAADRRAVDAVERVATRADTVDELFRTVAAEVRKTVPNDGSMWFGVDPATLLAVAPALIEHVEEGYCEPFWHGEFHEHDAILFRDLARGSVPAASLRAATGGTPLRSARYRDFIQPQGYDDELRAVLRVDGTTWAFATLLREKGHEPFDDDDVAFLNAISGILATELRVRAARPGPSAGLAHAPGLLVFDGDGLLVSANREATRWLGEVYGTGESADWVGVLSDSTAPDFVGAVPIIPLLARARAVASGHEDRPARLRLRDRTGRWVVLYASVLDAPTTRGTVAVVVEPAKSAEIAPIIIEAYGLTPRERDMVRAIARGLSTPKIAAELFLSAHTVRDYIKAVFEKVGVRSRAELVAKLFAEHYIDSLHENLVHVD